MRITKMHGAGNDFVIIENMELSIPKEKLSALAVSLCDRCRGVGGDGLVVLEPSERGADFKMLYYNRDGSRGEMCGNGARCICRYGYDNGYCGETQTVETDSGTVLGMRVGETEYRVRLNDPSVVDLRRVAEGCECAYVELGAPGLPHAVVMLEGWDELEKSELVSLGRKLRFSSAFPNGANVSFVSRLSENRFKAVTYERGVESFTLACGTGCGSIGVVLALRGEASPEGMDIEMPGGTISVSLTVENGLARDVFIQGPAKVAFIGETRELY